MLLGGRAHSEVIRHGSDEAVVVATTRPETMLGDTAVAVNPNDPRYSHLIGKHAILPLVGRRLTVIGDPIVAMDFGTGALKVTPSHDLTDFELSVRHNLDRVTVMDFHGRINERGIHFKGMDRYECRKAIVKELDELTKPASAPAEPIDWSVRAGKAEKRVAELEMNAVFLEDKIEQLELEISSLKMEYTELRAAICTIADVTSEFV